MVRNVEENYDLTQRLDYYLKKYNKYQVSLTIDEVIETLNLIKYIHKNRLNVPGQINLDL